MLDGEHLGLSFEQDARMAINRLIQAALEIVSGRGGFNKGLTQLCVCVRVCVCEVEAFGLTFGATNFNQPTMCVCGWCVTLTLNLTLTCSLR